jgi:hypothetical protein
MQTLIGGVATGSSDGAPGRGHPSSMRSQGRRKICLPLATRWSVLDATSVTLRRAEPRCHPAPIAPWRRSRRVSWDAVPPLHPR